jgi:hypothetical protein
MYFHYLGQFTGACPGPRGLKTFLHTIIFDKQRKIDVELAWAVYLVMFRSKSLLSVFA